MSRATDRASELLAVVTIAAITVIVVVLAIKAVQWLLG